MTIEKTPIEGLLVLQTENHEDNRGSFQKLFNHDFYGKQPTTFFGIDCLDRKKAQ